MSRSQEIRDILQQAARLDREWQGKADTGDRAYTPWMPFNTAEFLTLLIEAIGEAPGDRFLEIGSGIGTKLLLAGQIFGLEVHGIERVQEYSNQAVALLGPDRDFSWRVTNADAIDYDGYGKFDIIWFNRPFRDPVMQSALEQQVWAETAHGSVVICANLEDRPPSSWLIVDDDWERRRGCWAKPR